MITIIQTGDKYRARIRIFNKLKKIERNATFSSKLAAEKWATVTEQQILEGIDKNIDMTKTLKDALIRYRDLITPSKPGAKHETLRINAMLKDPNLPINKPLDTVTTDELAHWRRMLDMQDSSKNRVVAILRPVFEIARREWKWIQQNPLDDLRRLREPPPRDRRISDHEIKMICEELGFDFENPQVHLQKQKVGLIFLFALETAMRQKEITTLTWDRVHLKERYLVLIETKNGHKRDVPLSTKAIELLQIMKPRRTGDIFGITADTVSSTFRRCVRKCKIEDLRFHDTRHEACTRLAQKLEVLDLARMIGHRDPRSLMVYYNATATEIAMKLG